MHANWELMISSQACDVSAQLGHLFYIRVICSVAHRHPSSGMLFVSLLAVSAAAAPPTVASTLVVCIHEGTGFNNLDREPGKLGRVDRGSDVFISLMIDGDAENMLSTGVEAYNDRTPAWNQCFIGRHSGKKPWSTIDTPLVFVGKCQRIPTHDPRPSLPAFEEIAY